MTATKSLQVHIVSHTHWDREWYLTYEQFRLRLVGLIDRLLALMDAHPDYAYFHLDGQTIVLEDYLELRPHQEARLRQRIAEGRILIGPWYDMPDEFLVSGESIVRNLALGHRIAMRFGASMPVGYLPDLFGHVGQMPQILHNFGLDNAILWRGFGGPNAEYWWEAPDGSRVLMMHLPKEGYCNATRVHLNPDSMIERTTRAIETEASRTAVGEVLLMNGVDHVEPHPVIPQLARQLSDALQLPVKHSTLPAYVDAVRSAVQRTGIGASLDVVQGELRGGEDYANLLPGVCSARVYLKQANARVQALLEKQAEPLAVFASMLGAPYPADELAYAWKTLLQNHPHDSICGCSIDAVHDENMTRFARAEQVARGIVDQSAEVVARAVPAAPTGRLRLIAINTTAVSFDGVLAAHIDVPYESDEPWRVVEPHTLDAPVSFWPKSTHLVSVLNSAGEAMAFQILTIQESRPMVMSRQETPWILRARRFELAWRGHVPACGYATFDLVLDENPNVAASDDVARNAVTTTERSADNQYVRLTINADGTVDITDKTTGTVYARCGELEDVGDVGDEYNYSPPASDRRITLHAARDVRVIREQAGPIRALFRIELTLDLPVAAADDRTSRTAETVATPVRLRVGLDADSPRISWQVSLDNRSKDHRLRILFPTGADSVTEVRAETAFGVARRRARRERPEAIRMEVPVSYGPTGLFTEAGNDKVGAILSGEGLAEYEAVPDDDGRASKLALTLLRSVGYLSREDLVMRPSGHAGPGLETPGAQCLGRQRFRVAFEPRGAAPSNATLFARAASFVRPPHVVAAVDRGGTLPPTDTFVDVAGNVVLSACYRSRETGNIVMRLFNPDAASTRLTLRMRQPVTAASRVDFLERDIESVPVSAGEVHTEVAPYQIVTLKMRGQR